MTIESIERDLREQVAGRIRLAAEGGGPVPRLHALRTRRRRPPRHRSAKGRRRVDALGRGPHVHAARARHRRAGSARRDPSEDGVGRRGGVRDRGSRGGAGFSACETAATGMRCIPSSRACSGSPAHRACPRKALDHRPTSADSRPGPGLPAPAGPATRRGGRGRGPRPAPGPIAGTDDDAATAGTGWARLAHVPDLTWTTAQGGPQTADAKADGEAGQGPRARRQRESGTGDARQERRPRLYTYPPAHADPLRPRRQRPGRSSRNGTDGRHFPAVGRHSAGDDAMNHGLMVVLAKEDRDGGAGAPRAAEP